MDMLVIKTTGELNSQLEDLWREGSTIGLVPTMGALHEGHLEITSRALRENKTVVVSIFVNPTQFNDKSDLEKYPRTLDTDLELLNKLSDHLIVFTPSVEQMYGGGVHSGSYDFNGLELVMEGTYRPGHFEGVATIVEKLLLTVKPTNAYFGEKDYQQLQIIRSVIKQAGLKVNIVGCSIVRENNGLAMSSRNSRLSKRLRKEASFIYKILKSAKDKFGTESAASVKDWVQKEFGGHPDFNLEYFVIADAQNLRPVLKKIKGEKYRAFIAVYAEDVRLIDNVALN